MEKYFSIGEVAKLKDITVAALRFYHEKGLVIPSYIDAVSGYRYYTINQFIHIDIIKACRALGTSVEDLQELFREQDTEKLIALLKEKKVEAQQTIDRMTQMIGHIEEICDQVQYASEHVTDTEVSIKYFEERQVLEVPCHEVGENKELMYYSALQRKIKEVAMGAGAQRGIRYTIGQKALNPEAVFCVIEKTGEGVADNILPKGNYLTINYTKATERQQLEKIFKYIEQEGLKLTLYLEVDLLNDILFKMDDYSCQVQIHLVR